jgi:hypothetical protein
MSSRKEQFVSLVTAGAIVCDLRYGVSYAVRVIALAHVEVLPPVRKLGKYELPPIPQLEIVGLAEDFIKHHYAATLKAAPPPVIPIRTIP